ncbi:SAM-dependent methyltransferase [Rhodocytophaga rosea]|uniref:SAM-dependent methyltransferase n=1 Tax=Rhodocytophaga rosea TaxID=2704465 RepID=A0A6C0GFT2_9BACT|nr:SAM-dependent methyltransferase [Rhodocytophaga rosea]QHT66848.1 SAM-dependent methyltransferase [Rhodocytophaga rosea]
MPEKKGVLYLIPTVLAPATAGQVLSPQIKDVISHINHFFVENVRTARRFISELQTGKSIESLQFYTLDKDTPSAEVAQYINVLLNGEDAGVISEAGCPGIADPGAMAVQLAHKKEIQVVPLVGPSSILLALMASGFSGQSFIFHGYLPIDKTERAKSIRQLEKDSLQKNQTQICMETPFRNNQLLDDFLQTCQPDTLLCIATQITAPDELIRTYKIKDWAKHKPDLHKKPTIFLLYKSTF